MSKQQMQVVTALVKLPKGDREARVVEVTFKQKRNRVVVKMAGQRSITVARYPAVDNLHMASLHGKFTCVTAKTPEMAFAKAVKAYWV